MAKISLRAYDREIEGLIEHDQRSDEAIAHCRHILKTYPKHLETYRLLGKAYLEAKRYQEAVDLFERVLMAAPEDFVSHVGMSIIADDQGKLDEAIWHMERAFEMQPSNAAIQGELQRLFARRDGVEPLKIRLTRGALARMYMQGELYTQAISEIKAVLGGDPKRADMQVLLAKACYLSGQKPEATSLSTELLGRFPYCLDANRLMAEILPGTQRAESAQEYRQRVIDLDPYAAFAQESLFRSDSVADSAVSLERLEYTGPSSEQGPVLGLGPAFEARTFAQAAGEPDWLASGAAPPSTPSVQPAAAAAAAVPDFLRDAGWSERKPGSTRELEQPMAEDDSAPAAVPADLPAWVRAFAPAERNEPEPEPEPVSSPVEAPEWLAHLGSTASEHAEGPSNPEIDASSPDWLKDLGGREVDEPAALTKPPEPPEASASVQPPTGGEPDSGPSWLKEFETDLESPVQKSNPAATEGALPSASAEPAPSLGTLGTTAGEQDDAMAWLEGLAAKHGAKPEELVTDATTRTETAPDWVDRAREIAKKHPEAFPPPGARPAAGPAQSDLDLTGQWLSGLRTGQFEDTETEAESRPADSHDFDWINGISEQGEVAAATPETDKAEQSVVGADKVSGWLDDARPQSPEESRLGDAPSWLGHEVAEQPPARSQTPPGMAGEPGSAIDLPEWLAGLDDEKAGAAGLSGEQDVPLWLRSENEPTPPAAEPTQPADWHPAEPVESPAPEPAPASIETPAAESDEVASSATTSLPESVARPSVPPRPRPAPVPPKVNGAGQTSLEGAESELGRGNIAAALDLYARLIRRGKSLEDIIRDLRDALYRYPVEVPIWQALGDAYMRANRLQEALDAYTKAEELLR